MWFLLVGGALALVVVAGHVLGRMLDDMHSALDPADGLDTEGEP